MQHWLRQKLQHIAELVGSAPQGTSLDAQPEQAAPQPTQATEAGQKVPFFAWPLLACSILAVSSAAAVFQKMREVAPITLAAWRLQLTSVILFVGAVHQFRAMSSEDRSRTLQHSKWLAGGPPALLGASHPRHQQKRCS